MVFPNGDNRFRKKILVIDDDRFSQKMLALNFSHQGYITIAALDGQEGLEKALQEKPDLIIMDLMMPRLDGFEATRLLRSNPQTKDIPIIALTAKILLPDQPRPQEMGFDAYCTKPFRLKDLDELIEQFLEISSKTVS